MIINTYMLIFLARLTPWGSADTGKHTGAYPIVLFDSDQDIFGKVIEVEAALFIEELALLKKA